MRTLNGGAATPFVEQARRMLFPRYWAKADWRTRAETLATVDWLLRMSESAHAAANSRDEQGISPTHTSLAQHPERHLLNEKL